MTIEHDSGYTLLKFLIKITLQGVTPIEPCIRLVPNSQLQGALLWGHTWSSHFSNLVAIASGDNKQTDDKLESNTSTDHFLVA